MMFLNYGYDDIQTNRRSSGEDTARLFKRHDWVCVCALADMCIDRHPWSIYIAGYRDLKTKEKKIVTTCSGSTTVERVTLI